MYLIGAHTALVVQTPVNFPGQVALPILTRVAVVVVESIVVVLGFPLRVVLVRDRNASSRVAQEYKIRAWRNLSPIGS